MTNRHVAAPWYLKNKSMNQLFTLTAGNGQLGHFPDKESYYKSGYSATEFLSFETYLALWNRFYQDFQSGLRPNFDEGRFAFVGIVPTETSVNVSNWQEVALPCDFVKVATDVKVDIGLLQLRTKQLPPGCTAVSESVLIRAPDEIHEGDDVLIVSFPRADERATDNADKKLKASFLPGKVSQIKDQYDVQYNSFTEHGTSGAPVFNQRGQLIAVNWGSRGEGNNYDLGTIATHLRALLP